MMSIFLDNIYNYNELGFLGFYGNNKLFDIRSGTRSAQKPDTSPTRAGTQEDASAGDLLSLSLNQ